MAEREYPFVIGTAGHIDHGKTAVVKALSGVDCDRLAEEKKRGMTIELGFAPLDLPSGRTISIIDVPGHEKFIRQMVAGAAGIDAVMLVVAADDGVMPQTKEHLEILTLLGIKNGITVINKIDLVDEEMLELAKDDIYSLTAGTFLEGKPMIPVSALRGDGIAELLTEIEKMVLSTKQKERNGAFFMPIDRAFHNSGFGTVLTGTAIKGSVSEGDEVEIMPARILSRVRSVQVHGENVTTAYAGQRVAVNVSGTSLDEVGRGDVLAAPDMFPATGCIDVTVNALPPSPIPWNTGRGSGSMWERLTQSRGSPSTGRGYCPRERAGTAAARRRDNGEQRGPLHTQDLQPAADHSGRHGAPSSGERPKSKSSKESLISFLNEISSTDSDRDRFAALIDYKGILSSGRRLCCLGSRKMPLKAVSSLDAKGRIYVIKTGDTFYVSSGRVSRFKDLLMSELRKFHSEHPERRGMEADEAGKCLSVGDPRFLKELLKIFIRDKWLVLDGDRYRLSDFEPFDEARFFSGVSRLREFVLSAGYSTPSIEESRAALGISDREMSRIITYLKEKKDLALIGDGYLLLSDIEEDLRKKLAGIEGEITLAGIRDLTGSSRKYILPILEYFDSKGITRRVGDKRLLLKK